MGKYYKLIEIEIIRLLMRLSCLEIICRCVLVGLFEIELVLKFDGYMVI